MKTQSFFLGLFTLVFISFSGFAQKAKTSTENIKVWGNCGMCKKTIETAAKSAGVTEANWNEETKILAVSYDASKSNNQKIQKAIADAGYDTQDFTAPDNAYVKLHGCCQYDRKSTTVAQQAVVIETANPAKAKCCESSSSSSKSMDCCKDGKIMDCCKDGKCMDCCKDGKCEAGKDCCKGKDMAACKDKGCCKS